jgi:Holliday junction resolvase RusA-like endonuclease
VLISFEAPGLPVTQGSKRAVTNKYTGKIMLLESDKLKPWRAQVALAARQAMWGELLTEPVTVIMKFGFPRPKSHYGTGRNHAKIKPTAPKHPASKPDLDKLQRAIFDALTGVIWRDDCQVVGVSAVKVYAGNPGVNVEVRTV